MDLGAYLLQKGLESEEGDLLKAETVFSTVIPARREQQEFTKSRD